MENERTNRWTMGLPEAIGVAFVVLLFVTSVRSVPFYYDDYPHFVENPRIARAATLADIFQSGTQETRPLYNLSLALQAKLFGMGPVAAHAINFGLFLLCGAALWALLLSLGQGRLVAGLATLIFWIHPVALETVLYANSRAGLLAMLLTLLAFIALGKSAILCALGLVLAMLSKEDAAGSVLVGLWFLAWRGKSEKRLKSATILCATWVVLPLLYLSFRSPHVESIGGSVDAPIHYLWFQGINLPLHLSMFAAPWPLGVNRDLPDWMMSPWVWSLGWLALLACGAAVIRYRRTWIGFAMGWMVLALLPTHSWVPMLDVQASRVWFMALPAASLTLAIVLGSAIQIEARWGTRATLAFLILLATLNVREQAIWRDPVAFWEKNARLAPSRWRSWTNLAIEYGERGDWQNARSAIERAAALAPHESGVIYNRAAVAYGSGERGPWIEESLEGLLETHPEHARARALRDRLRGGKPVNEKLRSR